MVIRNLLTMQGLSKRGSGRPRTRGIDQGTPELQEKRAFLQTKDLDLSGTIASTLVKKKIITLQHLEIFQKINLLWIKYLALQKLRMTCHSQLLTLSTKSKNRGFYQHYHEDQELETLWQDIAHSLVSYDKRILGCVEKLFNIYNYEALPKQFERFIKDYSPKDIEDFAYICWSTWKALR